MRKIPQFYVGLIVQSDISRVYYELLPGQRTPIFDASQPTKLKFVAKQQLDGLKIGYFADETSSRLVSRREINEMDRIASYGPGQLIEANVQYKLHDISDAATQETLASYAADLAKRMVTNLDGAVIPWRDRPIPTEANKE